MRVVLECPATAVAYLLGEDCWQTAVLSEHTCDMSELTSYDIIQDLFSILFLHPSVADSPGWLFSHRLRLIEGHPFGYFSWETDGRS